MFEGNKYFEKYNCIVILIKAEELNKVNEITDLVTLLASFSTIFSKNNIQEFVNKFINKKDNYGNDVDLFIRFVYNKYLGKNPNIFYSYYNDLYEIDEEYGYEYNKVYTLYEFFNGDIKHLLENGIIRPTYKPKKLIYEKLNDYIFPYFDNYEALVISVPYEDEPSEEKVIAIHEIFDMGIEYGFIDDEDHKNAILQDWVDWYDGLDVYLLIIYKDGKYGKIKKISIYECIDDSGDTINIINKEYKYDKIYTLDDVSSGKIEKVLKGLDKPTYKPKKLIYENNNTDYSEVIYKVNCQSEDMEIQEFLFENCYSWGINDKKYTQQTRNYPYYLFINYDDKDILFLISNPSRFFDMENSKVYPKIFDITNYKETKYFLDNGKFRKIPDYKPKKLITEKLEEKILHIFDFDDTLVYSDSFENKVKHLLLEDKTPEDILLDEVEEIGADLSDLNYENGRIYVDDPLQNINIDNKQNWIRKKERLYLTQPDSYFLTDFSLPVGKNNRIVEFYNSVENKCILTIRPEKFRSKIVSVLNKFGIDYPNYGLYLFPSNKHTLKAMWKAENIIKICNENGFTSVNYYDDNSKMIKKIKHHINNRINITFYKIKDDEINIY